MLKDIRRDCTGCYEGFCSNGIRRDCNGLKA